jgi:hypothetical protein
VLATKLDVLESKSPFVVICWWLTCLKVSCPLFPDAYSNLTNFIEKADGVGVVDGLVFKVMASWISK